MRWLTLLAVAGLALSAWAVIPVAKGWAVADLNVGVLYIFALSSLMVYGVIMAGGIVMPINVRLSQAELITVLNHSGARTLLFETDFGATVEALKPHCPRIEHFISLNEPHPAADRGWIWRAG